ncbi:13498_t:CDS:2 [Entrophospora sp. SA101]|nr:13498_t:CDS:2 [Entrophospora sp. SA101]
MSLGRKDGLEHTSGFVSKGTHEPYTLISFLAKQKSKPYLGFLRSHRKIMVDSTSLSSSNRKVLDVLWSRRSLTEITQSSPTSPSSPTPDMGFSDEEKETVKMLPSLFRCAKVDRTWFGICNCHRGSYNSVYNTMTTQFQGSEVWLIGHSLGGSLTLLPGLTYGLPVVAYEAPGERQAAKGLHLSGPSAVPYEQLSVWHIEQLLTLFTWAFIM